MITPVSSISRPLTRMGAISALAALGLAACSTTAPSVDGGVSSGAPLPNAGYDWYLNSDDTEISLSYGLAETDDVPMDLSCEAGSKRLTLLLNVEKGHPLRIDLESGGETETYHATGEAAPLSNGVDLTATAPSTDPVFLRFRQLGWLAVSSGSSRRPLVATPATLPLVERFFQICEQTG